jgi:hypothetical protein
VPFRPNIKDLLLMVTGAAVTLVIMLIMLHFRTEQSPAGLIAGKAKRMDLVAGIQAAMALASEAEKSAVMAITDQDSQTYANQSRSASAQAERKRKELGNLLEKSGTKREKDLFARFSKEFADLQRLDHDLLALAVQNTNLKAYTLAFGPAAQALMDMDSALSRLVAKNSGSPEAAKVAQFALAAQTAALRIQTLLAPHIAEESGRKMDEMEVRMAQRDEEVRKNLADLAALPKVASDPDFKAASAGYARFNELRARIIALSRENTNVRSLSISLGQKRKALSLCQDTLDALRQAIQDEPIPGVDHGAPYNPRMLGNGKQEQARIPSPVGG